MSDEHYDLLVLGAGSGNMLFGPELAHLRTALVEPGAFGGTCLNRGCIPSKMYVLAADAARAVPAAARLGVHARLERVDWPAIRDRVFGRTDAVADDGAGYRRSTGVHVYADPARFIGPRVLQVGSRRIEAEQVVVAVGSRPTLPPIAGLDEVPFHTSDTVLRIEQLPQRMLIVGGGFIAAELGHVFSSFGVRTTIVQQGPVLVPTEDATVAEAFTELAGRHHRLLLNSEVVAVHRDGPAVMATVRTDGEGGTEQQVSTDLLLVATGRRPNSDLIDAPAGELALDTHGHLITDEFLRTTVPGVWALGDVTNHFQLKHLANAEARVVRHNLAHPAALRTRPPMVPGAAPHAVFADPQLAAFGLTEQQAREAGREVRVAVRHFRDTAYGWALEDTTSFVKLVADARSRTLLGAHVLGPQAATLIQPLLQGATLGQTVDVLAREVIYIHPALTEVLEQALLAL